MKLTLLVSNEPIEKVFDASTVTLGSSAELSELLSERFELLPEHVRIIDQHGQFTVINLANDPFVTLNGRPFGKKTIKSGDRLSICGVEIIFDGNPTSVSTKLIEQPVLNISDLPLVELEAVEKKLQERLERSSQTPAHSQNRIEPFEDDTSIWPEEEEEEGTSAPDDIEALLNQVDRLESPKDAVLDEIDKSFPSLSEESISSFEWPETDKSPATPSKYSKDWYPSTPVESATHHANVDTNTSPARLLWRPVVVVGMVIVALLLTLASGLYFTFSEQTDEQEYLAAQGVADVAMALTYADMHALKPPNQNWSDPEFLQTTLDKVLPVKYPSMVAIDAQGNFKNSPYLLRVYTSNDLSQFVLVAQPSSSLWHWFSRRRSIVLDSLSMELRTIEDLRELNRLLANTHALEGSNAVEIEALVRSTTKLMRLSKVAAETGHREFMPPKELSKMRPGAENLVHNAPRYYRFAEPAVRALASLQLDSVTFTPSPEQLSAVSRQLGHLSKFANLVLYAENQRSGEKADAVLAQVFPKETMLIGYFKPNADAAMMQVDNNKRAPLKEVLGPPTPDSTKIPPVSKYQIGSPREGQSSQPSATSSNVIFSERERILSPLSQQIAQLFAEHNRQPMKGFYQRLTTLINEYKEADNNAAAYPTSAERPEGNAFSEQFSNHLHAIRDAKDLFSLDHAVAEGRQWLKSSKYQDDSAGFPTPFNRLQMHALARLEEFLLSPTTPLSPTAFQPRNRNLIINILNNSGIRDTSQRDYYLQEFDMLTIQNQ